jgi:hypothetical protein
MKFLVDIERKLQKIFINFIIFKYSENISDPCIATKFVLLFLKHLRFELVLFNYNVYINDIINYYF